jgi:hypothetical protein
MSNVRPYSMQTIRRFVYVLCLACSVCANASSEDPSFGMAHDGTLMDPHGIWRYAAASNRIPLNRTYQQLTEEQRLALLSFYEAMSPSDEPPFPVEGLRSIVEPLVIAQRTLLASGKLALVADVDSLGVVTSVKAYGSPSPAMTKFASQVLLLTNFKPALCSGSPCKMQFPFYLEFKVK